MSNKIDFFQSEQTSLTLPATSVSILIDRELCTDLELIEIVRSGWPEFSSARFNYNPAAHPIREFISAEDIESKFAPGKSISIRQYYNGVPPGAGTFSFPIFQGHIEHIKTTMSETGERVEIIAADFGVIFHRISVHGQRLVKTGISSVFLTGLDTIFNPEGKGNATPKPITVNGRSYTVFCADPLQSKFWNYAEVIDYLLCEYMPSGECQRPTLDQLKALTENQIVRDLDVTKLNLAEALYQCCEQIGLKFKFVPTLTSTGPSQAIVFYKSGTGRSIELTCQSPGEQLSLSKTNIAAVQSSRNRYPATHKYIGQGDFKVYEATFELIKAWDAGLEESDYDTFSPSTNPDFYQVKDVYRKWCLNETGQYSNEPYNQGDVFDFTTIFQSNHFVHRRRRFRPALTTDSLGRSLGYFLQVSYDSGQTWWQYLHAFNILLDECGVWLSSDQLDTDTWVAALQDTLRFRITASVISDERLTATVTDGPVHSVAPVIEHVMTLPRQFKYREVSNQSIFFGSTDQTLGTPDEVDDSDALHEFVRHTAVTSPEVIETFDIQTPSLMFDCQVGDTVTTSPESRDLLACWTDNRSTSRIAQVKMNFKKQCTNLKIIRQRNYPL
ncbi:MAG: hypothetical protein JXM79_16065 [Sedimentisphaerales bacterium]|nr:hypothetical protein [Sedimentisphaerales bacterium]